MFLFQSAHLFTLLLCLVEGVLQPLQFPLQPLDDLCGGAVRGEGEVGEARAGVRRLASLCFIAVIAAAAAVVAAVAVSSDPRWWQ